MRTNEDISLPKDVIFLEDDLPFGRKQFIIASVEKNCFLQTNYNQFRVLKLIDSYVKDGISSLNEIEDKLLKENKIDIDIDQLYKVLEKNSLLESSQPAKSNSEAEMMAIKLYEHELSLRPVFRGEKVIVTLLYILFVLSLIYNIINFNNLVGVYEKFKFQFNNSNLLGIFIGGLISIISLMVHEYAHIFAARSLGIKNTKLYIILYALFIPTYYTHYKQMNALAYHDKMKILSAGLKSNIFALFLAFALLGLGARTDTYYEIMAKIVLVNLQFIAVNVSPFAMNDGYFMLLNSLGLAGIRVKMWNIIKSFFKNGVSRIRLSMKKKILIGMYTLISLYFIFINAYTLITWIVKAVLEIM